MKKIFIIIVCVIVTNYTEAQHFWNQHQEGLPTKTKEIFSLTGKAETFFALTRSEICKSDDNGKTWRGIVNLSDIGISPKNLFIFNETLFLSTVNSGLLKSTDNGNIWEYASDLSLYHNVIAMAESDDCFFLGTSHGLYTLSKATNEVKHIAEEVAKKTIVNDILINENAIFVAANFGLYQSSDKGKTWARAKGIPSNNSFMKIAASGNVVVALSSSGIYRSADNGITWIAVKDGYVNELFEVSAAAAYKRFFVMTSSKVYSADDNGNNWKVIHNNPSYNNKKLFVVNNELYLSNGNGFFKWNNKEDIFETFGQGLPQQQVPAFQITGDDKYLFIATDLGAYYSSDKALSWHSCLPESVNKNLKYIYKADNTAFILTNNEVLVSENNLQMWTPLSDERLEEYMPFRYIVKMGTGYYLVNEIGDVLKSEDNAKSWVLASDGGLNSVYINSFLMHQEKIYAATSSGVYCYSPATKWKKETLGFSKTEVLALATQGATLFASTAKGIFKKNNETWKYSSIGIDEDIDVQWIGGNDSLLFAYAFNKLYISDDKGEFWYHDENTAIGSDLTALYSDKSGLYFGSTSVGVLSIYMPEYSISRTKPEPSELIKTLVTDQAEISRFKMPEDGDYVLIRPAHETKGNLIYKKSKMVYYGYDFSKNEAENAYKQSKDLINELFGVLETINIPSLMSMVEENVPKGDERFDYDIVEYRKEGNVYRICWNTKLTTKESYLINRFIGNLGSLW